MTKRFDQVPSRSDGDWSDFEEWSDDPAGHGSGPDVDPRLQAGLEHLQRAAHEVIAASRALLDVAEDIIESPGGISRVASALGELGDLAARVARSQVERPGSDDGHDQDPPVQRIPVS